jgi:hypothetical protein
VFILKVVKVLCFDTLLQVFILKGLTGDKSLVKKALCLATAARKLDPLVGSLKQKRQQRRWRYGHEACYYPPLMICNRRVFVKIENRESAVN